MTTFTAEKTKTFAARLQNCAMNIIKTRIANEFEL